LAASLPMTQALAQSEAQCNPIINIDTPSQDMVAQDTLTISGWAVDTSASQGSGIYSMEVVADAPIDQGGTVVGNALFPVDRMDVDAALGVDSSFGFTSYIDLTAFKPGMQDFFVYATDACGMASTSLAMAVEPTPRIQVAGVQVVNPAPANPYTSAQPQSCVAPYTVNG